MCKEHDIDLYIYNDSKCVKIATVIANHQITNKIDSFTILALFILMFMLF